jgi:tetratricopeptide (TPR) repeat protein
LAATVCLAADTDAVRNSPQNEEGSTLTVANVPSTEGPADAQRELQQPATALARGDVLMARKMYREAIESYSQGIHEIAAIYNKIGIAYHQLNDFDAALDNYKLALDFDPDYAEVINNIGTVYYAQKRVKKAIKQYEKALEYAPRSASIYSNLGTAHFARKKYNQAFEAYQKALSLDPNVFESRNTAGSLLQDRSVEERAKYHFYLAKTYAKAGMIEQAISYIRRALEEGYDDRERLRKDPDFAAVRETEEFEQLMAIQPRVL